MKLTIEEINLMPIDALTSRDLERINGRRLKYSNYSYERITAGVPRDEKDRILQTLEKNDARWYWIWVRRGLDPEKALRKVQVDNAVSRRSLRNKKIDLALCEVIYARPRRPFSPMVNQQAQ
jgi:hypothetical protein